MARGFAGNLLAAVRIARKDAEIYYFKFPSITMGLLLPFFMYLSFYFGRDLSSSEVLPGLAAITAFFGASTIGVTAITYERATGTLEMQMTMPFPLLTLVFGKALASFAFGSLLSIGSTAILALSTGTPIMDPGLFIVSVAFSSLASAGLGMLVSAASRNTPRALMPLNLIRLPMMFISGVFTPVKALATPLQAVARLVPLTYSVDVMSKAITGFGTIQAFLVSLVALSLYSIAFILIATKRLEKSMQ